MHAWKVLAASFAPTVTHHHATANRTAAMLRTLEPRALAGEFAFAGHEDFMANHLEEDRNSVRVYSIARLPTDDERGFLIVRSRTQVALVLAMLSYAPPEQHWWDEFSATLTPLGIHSMRTFTSAGATTSPERSLYGLPLQFDSARVAAALDQPQGLGRNRGQPNRPIVIKGGSFLCSPDYCVRYRASAREAQEADLPAAHIGFRTILRD